MTEFIIKSNLVGCDSQGIIRLMNYLNLYKKGEAKSGIKIKLLKETSSTAVIDGRWGFGQIVACQAMRMVIQKARKNSVSVVTVHHCNHIGRLSNYAVMAAKQHMIGIVIINGTEIPF